MDTLDTAIPYLQQYSYVGVFVLILVFSFLLPLSKTLLLVAAGILASKGVGTLPGYFLASLAGFLLADGVYFSLGYMNRRRVMNWKYFSNERRKTKLEHADELFRKRGWVAVMAARFLPFIRAFIYLVAGLNRMHPLQFLLVDSLATAALVAASITIGYLLAENQELILKYVSEVELILAVVAFVAIVVFLLRKIMQKGP